MLLSEQDHPGPHDVQRGPVPPVPGGAPREHHQRRGAHGRLLLHPRRAARADRGRVQRGAPGAPGPAQRVHEQRKSWALGPRRPPGKIAVCDRVAPGQQMP